MMPDPTTHTPTPTHQLNVAFGWVYLEMTANHKEGNVVISDPKSCVLSSF